MAIVDTVRSRKILGAVPGVPDEWQAVYQSTRLLQLSPTDRYDPYGSSETAITPAASIRF